MESISNNWKVYYEITNFTSQKTNHILFNVEILYKVYNKNDSE